MYWIAIAICLLISFVFSGIEAGILSVNRIRLRNRVKLRDKAALRLDRLLKRPERLLITVVIVTNLMNILAITLTTSEFVRWWGRSGYLATLILFLPLYLFGLELFPKSLFRRFPYRALALLSEPLRIADKLFSPIVFLGSLVAHWVVPKDEPYSRKLFAGREDFKYFTVESERSGTLSPVERQLIHNVIDYRSVNARDLMQPVSNFPVIRQDATVDELIAASRDGTLERFLAVADNGEILGLVNLFEAVIDRGPTARVSTYIRRLLTVAPVESAPRLLRKLCTARTPVALVVDAGQPVGLVFDEALYRRLVSPAATLS